ncbi:hypothetical protein [Desulfovibrio oxyclinae]|uniref:hypothetical protein n=1 Tax=Desulfovibrio oxyclinae TaxID=63560 RepID=UPI00039BA8E8|nr:hypothetical protein [Desulfovibrio oxyclinae]
MPAPMTIISMPDEVNGGHITVAGVSYHDMDMARQWFERVRPHADSDGPLLFHLVGETGETLETISIGLDTAEEMLDTELTLEKLHHLAQLQQRGEMVTALDLDQKEITHG